MASISFTCPNCAKVLRTGTRPPTGKKVRCPACSQVFVPDLDVEEEAASIQEKPSARPKLKSTKAEDDAEPAPPRQKRMRDEEDADEDDRPVKKKKSKRKQASSSTMLFVLIGLAGGGGLLSCILCGVGAFVWPGFMKSANTDLAAFVPEDANLVMGGNPKLMKSRMANLEQLIRQQGPFGAVNQQQMEDVTFNSERMLAFSNTRNVQGGLVTVYQSSADDIAKIKRNPGLGAATTIGGHGNIHKQGMQGRPGTLPRFVAFPGGNIVVTADQNERDLLAALDRARDGAKPNAALEFGRSVDQSPFWLAFVPDGNSIAQMRKGIEDGGPMAPQGMKDAAPALAGIKGATVAADFTETQDIKLNANIHCKNAEDAAKIKTAVEETWGVFKGMMQLAAGFQMPGQPQLPATLMGDLSSVAFATKGDTVTGAVKISSQTFQDLAKAGAGQMMMPGMGPGPAPINPKFPAKKGFAPPDLNKKGFQPQFGGGLKDATPDDMKRAVGKLEPGKGASFTVNNVPQGQYQERRYTLQQGKRVTVTMTSTVTDKFTDVDLYVYQGDVGEQVIAVDPSVGPNGTVTFVVPMTGTYRVRVVNLGPGIATSSVVTITEQ